MNEHESAPESNGARCFEGRFTPSDGLRGWVQARNAQRQSYYGAGSLAIRPEFVTLRGWQRTWLGTAEAVEVAFAPSQIRNSARRDETVRFEVCIGRRWRNVEFTVPDVAAAEQLLSALPATRTDGFEEAWVGLQEFNRVMAAQAGWYWVTPALVVVNLAAFVAVVVRSGGTYVDPQEMARWANAGLVTTRGEWWRLLTATFLHWNLIHVALNMWALWNAGRLTERLYGSTAFLALYLASGVFGSLASIAWNPSVVSAGASGAVFGVLGALLACTLRSHGLPRVVVKAHRWSTLTFVVLNLTLGAISPTTDNAAHLGGLAAGILLGRLLARPIWLGRHADLTGAQVAAAAGVVAATLGLGVYFMQGPAPDADGPYSWAERNEWYVEGEVRHFRLATALDWKLNSGQISPAEYSASIRRDLLPFLQQAASRMEREAPTEPRSSPTSFQALVFRWLQSRRDWLVAVADSIDISKDADTEKVQNLNDAAERAKARIDVAHVREQFDGRPMGVRAWLLDAYWLRKYSDPADCVLPPEVLRRAAYKTDSPIDGPARRREAGCAAQRSFMRRDYAELERRFAAAKSTLGDLPDGSSTYTGIVSGLTDLMEFGHMPVELQLQRFGEWRRSHPESALPDLLEAGLYHESAWAARGHGYAKEVRAQDWQLFRYRVSLARAILDEVAERSRDQPYWYSSSINVGLDSKDSLESIRARFDVGARRFPSYEPLYRAMLRVLMPRWRGSSAEIADFVDQASFAQPDSTYARLYTAYAYMEGDDVDIFRNPRVNWPRIRAGLELLRNQHSSSDFMVNASAYMACRKGDREAYAQVRTAAVNHPSYPAWSNKYTLSSCDERLAGREAAVDLNSEVAPIAPVGGRVDSSGTALTAADVEWVRRQTAMALQAAEPVRAAITKYVEQHGRLPSHEVLRQSPEFRAVNPMGAVVATGLGASINMTLRCGAMDGRKFSWTPYLGNGDVRWECAQETVPEEYLGAPCR